ncbi:MAG TPA: hypothetical protein DCL35_01805 [Candidatus Omnitrophica bacterium]|nr:hypothetical protein [Candidatus Omnitrophota bacterium]
MKYDKFRNNLEKMVSLFKKTAARYSLSSSKYSDLYYKLCVLQVYTGLKRAGTLDSYKKKFVDFQKMVSFLNKLEIHYSMLDMGVNIKVFFSKNKTDLSDLSALHNAVFNLNASRDEYGNLLGYPKCCVLRFISKPPCRLLAFPTCHFENKAKRNIYELSFKINRLASFPLIQHTPCKITCHKTIELADKILKLYKTYDLALAKRIILELKKPVLVFGENNYIRLNGEYRKDTIFYSSLEHVNPLFIEDGSICENDIKTIEIAGLMKEGNRLSFGTNAFKILKNDKLILTNRFSSQQFQLINFQ